MKEITTLVEAQVVADLKAHHDQQSKTDFSTLLDICDASQDRAARALVQLQQRMILDPATTGLDRRSTSPPIHEIDNSASMLPERDVTSSQYATDAVSDLKRAASSSATPSPTSTTTFLPQFYRRPESSLSHTSTGSFDTVRRKTEAYKPMATTVTKAGLFGIGRRTKVELVTSPRENPLVDEYFAGVIEGKERRMSQATSVRSAGSTTSETVELLPNSWREDLPSSSVTLSRPTESTVSFDSMSRLPQMVYPSNRSTDSVNSRELLPNELNNFGGFCKGAWRQQVGDSKRAMEERIRPGGMYHQAKYWQCRHCKFEGRSVPIDKKKSGYDMRVFKLVEGIQFRWEFMFKSHVPSKDADSSPTKAAFGCIFCCTDGKGTPICNGIQSFMDHLTEHRGKLPAGDVLYRMNCLVGRQAAIVEDFDINIVGLDDSQF